VLRPNYRPYCKHARPTQCSASKCIARSQFPVCSCGAGGAACVPDGGASDRGSSSPCRLPGSQEAASLPAVSDCTHLSVGCVAAQSQDARAPQRWAECWQQLHGGRETGGNEALQAARAYQPPSYVQTQVRLVELLTRHASKNFGWFMGHGSDVRALVSIPRRCGSSCLWQRPLAPLHPGDTSHGDTESVPPARVLDSTQPQHTRSMSDGQAAQHEQ
jgi:hypothetical protein